MTMKQAVFAVLAVIFALLVSVCEARPSSPCYLVLSYGQGKVKELGTTRFEDRIFAQRDVLGSYQEEPKSNPHEFGVGCDINRYFSVELAHREGLSAIVRSKVLIQTALLGSPINTGFEIRRYTEISGYSVSAIGKVPIYKNFYGTAHVAGMYAKGYLSATSPDIPYEIETGTRKEGVIPIVGLGIMYQHPEKKFSLKLGAEAYHRYVYVTKASILIYF
jgi:hypothetical protein